MSKKQPVMSHDPLAEIDAVGGGETESEPSAEQVAEVESKQDEAEDATSSNAPSADASVPQNTQVALESNLTIAEVAELHGVMLGHVQSMVPFAIDAKDVELVDAAGMQLLAVTFKSAVAKGLEVSLSEPSEALVDAAHRIGLADMLGIEQQSAA